MSFVLDDAADPIRLMEDYDLRACFLPDLSGLHLRIFQFQKLLQQHTPRLAAHFESLQVEPAYLSQWFLSFFAVTCPLPMLFRIYDVIFAEGASETVMRVALALMKRNEQKILAFTEFEDVMQLLLSRALWDPYGRHAKSADELVQDFVGFTNDVTRERLQKLEVNFRDHAKHESAVKKGSEVQKSATSFLGRLWGPSNATKSVTLSPHTPSTAKSSGFLRRSTSKQSLASTQCSVDSIGTQSTALTAWTDPSRTTSGDGLSLRSVTDSVTFITRTAQSAKDRDLHYQIEHLLTTVGQLQRQNAELETAVQSHREERDEDAQAVSKLVMTLESAPWYTPSPGHSRRRTMGWIPAAVSPDVSKDNHAVALHHATKDVAQRFRPASRGRPSSPSETKEHLRESLARTKELLASEGRRAQLATRELADREVELSATQETLRETRQRLQEAYRQNQKSEQSLRELRSKVRAGSLSSHDHAGERPSPLARSDTSDSVSSANGLRELKLGQSAGTRPGTSRFAKRSSSLATQTVLATENQAPADNETLLLELVNAKTAEAVAKQELEELRSRFDSVKRAMSVQMAPSTTSPARSASASTTASTTPSATPPPSSTSGGGFWSGWKRNVSTSTATLAK